MKSLLTIVLSGLLFFSCKKNEGTEAGDIPPYFLSDLRPRFFEHLNFESASAIAQVPSFYKELTETYNALEKQYQAGQFKSSADLENMRLLCMYYSFYSTALVRGYLDSVLTYDNFAVSRDQGFISKLPSTEPGFQQKEMEAMMQKAVQAAALGININGYSDKMYGFYLCTRQNQERLKSKVQRNNPAVQDSMIAYTGVKLVNYTLFAPWNILMAMTTFTNYTDSLNTFNNPRMDYLLSNAEATFIPGTQISTGVNFPEILGPVFRFDLNLKKIDWLLHQERELGKEELKQLDSYINVLDSTSNFVAQKKKAILDAWPDKATFEERLAKVKEIKNYRTGLSAGTGNIPRPALTPYLNSKSFNKAYQCYSCHRTSGL